MLRFLIQVIVFLVSGLLISQSLNAKSLGVSGFELINPKTGDVLVDGIAIANFSNLVFNLNEHPDGLTFFFKTVNFGSSEVVKVVFFLNGKEIRTERFAPYALAGDYQGEIFPYDFVEGAYVLKAVIYFKDEKTPAEEIINFRIDTRPKIAKLKFIDAQKDGVLKVYCAALDSDVNNFSEIFQLLKAPEYFSIEVEGFDTKSVVFEYAYTAPGDEAQALKYLRTENIKPYASFGDDLKGNYYGRSFEEGQYKIRVTPYAEPKGKGRKGASSELHLLVETSITSAITPKAEANVFAIIPNPVIHKSTITCQHNSTGYLNLELLDLNGNLIKQLYFSKEAKKQNIRIDLDAWGLREGIYILRKQTREGTEFKKVVIK